MRMRMRMRRRRMISLMSAVESNIKLTDRVVWDES